MRGAASLSLRLALVAGAIGSAAACTLFPSFAGFTGGTDAGTGADRQGAADAGKSTGWCASQDAHTLCDDFDEPDAGVVGPWLDEQATDAGGSLSLSSAYAVSVPNSLLATMPPTSSTGAYVRLKASYGAPATGFTYAFDFLTEQPGLNGGTVLANVAIPLSNGEVYAVDVRLESSALQVYEQQGSSETVYDVTTLPATGTWERISLQVNLQSPPTLVVDFGAGDGGPPPQVGSWTLKGIVGTTASGGPQPLLGLAYLDQPTNGTLACYFDNVTFDLE